MAHGLDSTKGPARPSHEAIESETPATDEGKSKQTKMDHIAMQAAKRAENRIRSNEETTPDNTTFTKFGR